MEESIADLEIQRGISSLKTGSNILWWWSQLEASMSSHGSQMWRDEIAARGSSITQLYWARRLDSRFGEGDSSLLLEFIDWLKATHPIVFAFTNSVDHAMRWYVPEDEQFAIEFFALRGE